MPEGELLVNWEQVLDAVGGDPELLDTVLAAFLEEVPTQLAEIRQALAAQQLAPIRRPAHTLKTNLRYVGSLAVAEAAERLEHLTTGGDRAAAQTIFEDLEPRVQRVLECLAARLASGN